jgi:acyl-CoA synthetase (AMP-forming)/AMP-acid ligase II/1-acyl-sn-glycerol-3-phosphate acyltransferase/acyl carrier protein
MLRWLRSAFWALMRLLLSFRYRVRVHGRKQLRGLKGPVVVFPNHPGYIDPALVLSQLWPTLHLKPVLYEGLFLQPGYFRTPLAYPLIKFLGALLVPDLNRPSARARARAEQAVAGVIEGLARGEHYILWPSGHVQRDGVEHLRAARALTDILRAAPGATVVLVRTRGLWGSMFTYAQTGERPPLMGRLWAAAGWLLANLLLFMPRRSIDITVEVLDRSKLPPLERDKVNRWFEAWYNAGGPDQPTYVPYHRLFGARSYEFPRPPAAAALDVSRVTAETKAEVAHILEGKLGWPLGEAERQPETTLDQLGIDSLGRMEITLAVEQRFGFASAQAPNTVGELWLLAQGLAEEPHPQPAPPEWSRPPAAGGPPQIKGETLGEAFVNQALAHPDDVAVADDQAGVLTYRRLLVGVLTLARRFAGLPGARVGLLLPASAACDTALLALHWAGKVPVILNWTTGPANLAHAAQAVGLTHVVTSEAFLDRTGVQIDGVEYVCLEDVRQGIGRWELLRTLMGVRLLPGRVRRRAPKVAADQPAVILFTSGSEKAPKAVPLTHANLLSNQRAALGVLGLTRKDCVLGFLPAFHSFGLTLTGLLPLLAGIRVVRHPDPTGAATLARKTAAYRPTLLAGTPTFVSAILRRATPEQLGSLRLLFVGAEKCPQALQETASRLAPGALLLEGYGITECGPVVAVNRPGANRPGTVGRPVPGVEVCVVEPETEGPLPPGRVGELWVSGPSVFPGYLAYDGESPFRERQGRRWYVTGDLAEVDADGFIRLAGRKKRFLKAGGEMISLPALEEPFARRYPPTERGPRVAVEGVETAGGRRVVLFSTEPLGLREANALLHEEGFRGVMRLDEVRRVAAVPVLGTGKTDYRTLRALLSSPGPAAELVAR